MEDSNVSLEAVDKLTKPWGHLFGPKELGPNTYQRVENDALLDMLHNAIHASLGGTVSGNSPANTRNPINLRAFEMWENVDGLVRAWAKRLEVAYTDDLKSQLRRVYVKVAAGPQESADQRQFRYMVRGWVASISDMFDPVITKELIADCPVEGCGQRYVQDEHGDLASALVAYYRKDQQPEAKCRSCGTTWEGERALLGLGYSIKATVDEEALREMGIAL